MGLHDLMLQNQAAIAERWLEKTLATYPPDAVGFFGTRKNRFANPVGATLTEGTSSVLQALLSGAEPEALCAALEPMIKIRSVQDFTPGRAVAFVFALKSAVREQLGAQLDDPRIVAELRDFDKSVDQLALFAFDLYTKSRDRLHQIRINDVKRRVSGLMRRMGIGLDDLAAQGEGVDDES